MYFQILDDKEDCLGLYHDGAIDYSHNLNALSRTWRYAPSLRGADVEYAQIYCGGQTLVEVCPPHLRDRYSAISTKLKAFLRSFREAKINLSDNCFFDMVPERFLLEFCEIKTQITKYVFENFSRPKNYRFLASTQEMLYDISQQKLNIDVGHMSSKLGDLKARNFLRKIKNSEQYIDYDLFGTKTGRLSTRKGSFPLMTLSKDYRGVLKPRNDFFVELDYNAAELRTMLALSGHSQPDEDIHQWNVDNIYKGAGTRDEAKKRIFAWLYNPKSKDRTSEEFYDRDKILTQYWSDGIINTPFGRRIEVDRSKALNYLIQSTTSDLFLRSSLEIFNRLSETQSHVAFLLHDSIVIDLSSCDRHMLGDLVKTFSKTELGDFRANVSAGRSFGDMRRLEING